MARVHVETLRCELGRRGVAVRETRQLWGGSLVSSPGQTCVWFGGARASDPLRIATLILSFPELARTLFCGFLTPVPHRKGPLPTAGLGIRSQVFTQAEQMLHS